MSLAPALMQDNFSLGEFRGRASHLIPSGGAARCQNMLLEDDGSLYGRRGSAYISSAAFGSSGLRGIWAGSLAGGDRVVFANTADFGVLDSNGTSVVNVGGTGLSRPLKAAVKDGLLYWGDHIYGGSRKTGNYSTGTVAVTAGSTAVTGTGTSWSANVDAGMVLVVGSRAIAVRSVGGDTSLTLQTPWPGATASGLTYVAYPIAAYSGSSLPLPNVDAVAVAGQRLCVADQDKVYESSIGDPVTGIVGDPTTWDTTADVWTIPDGVNVTGLAPLGDSLVVFTTGGIWAISNLAYAVLDDAGNLQQRLEKISGDLILWDQAGIAAWEDQLVVPCTDGLWAMGRNTQKLLSRSISPRWRELARLGYRLGNAAVFRGHYIVPIIDTGNDFVDMLVCRLDRPSNVSGFGEVWPFTTWAGSAAEVAGVAVRTTAATREPELLGACLATAGRVIEYAPFKADGAETDHDGTAPEAYVVTRDYGPLKRSTVKRLRAWYELIASGTATLDAGWGAEARPATSAGAVWDTAEWDEFMWATDESDDDLALNYLNGLAPESNGDVPYSWTVGKRCQFVRFRLRCDDAAARFVVRGIEVYVRPSGRI